MSCAAKQSYSSNKTPVLSQVIFLPNYLQRFVNAYFSVANFILLQSGLLYKLRFYTPNIYSEHSRTRVRRERGAYSNIRQSNPSGCVALALHNTLTTNGIGYIQTMIVPVRYTDFDSSKNRSTGQGEGIIEKYVKPWLDEVDMIITISQAGPDDYNIDVFSILTRGGLIDNLGYERMKESRSINSSTKETIVTTLPDEFATTPSNASFYGKYFKTLSEYISFNGDTEVSPNNSTKSDYPTTKTYYGPGGNYLSNEIFYRVAKLREEWIAANTTPGQNPPTKPTGHFHIAKLQDASSKEDFNISETQTLLNIVKTAINKGVTGI